MYSCHFYATSHGDNYIKKLQMAIDMGCLVFVTECNATSFTAEKKPVDEVHAMVKPIVTKTSRFTYNDLSDTRKWLYDNIFRFLN